MKTLQKRRDLRAVFCTVMKDIHRDYTVLKSSVNWPLRQEDIAKMVKSYLWCQTPGSRTLSLFLFSSNRQVEMSTCIYALAICLFADGVCA